MARYIDQLNRELDVANERLAKLGGDLDHCQQHNLQLVREYNIMVKEMRGLYEQRKQVQAAEATAMDALRAHESYCQSGEYDHERAYNVFARLKYKALAQSEQPREQAGPNDSAEGMHESSTT